MIPRNAVPELGYEMTELNSLDIQPAILDQLALSRTLGCVAMRTGKPNFRPMGNKRSGRQPAASSNGNGSSSASIPSKKEELKTRPPVRNS